jgi:hypothetical protein
MILGDHLAKCAEKVTLLRPIGWIPTRLPQAHGRSRAGSCAEALKEMQTPEKATIFEMP